MIGGAPGGASSLPPFDGVDSRGVFSDDIFQLCYLILMQIATDDIFHGDRSGSSTGRNS